MLSLGCVVGRQRHRLWLEPLRKTCRPCLGACCFGAPAPVYCMLLHICRPAIPHVPPCHYAPQEAAQSAEVLAALQKRNEELAASKDGEAVADLQR